MKIATVISHYIGGGAEKVTDIVSAGLIAKGHSVTLITSELNDVVSQHAKTIYSQIIIIPGLGRYDIKNTKKLADLLYTIKADALILLVDDYPDLTLLRKALNANARIIYHPHNSPLYQVKAKISRKSFKSSILSTIEWYISKKLPEQLFNKYTNRYLKRIRSTASDIDAFISLSDADTKMLQQLFPSSANKFITIKNPITIRPLITNSYKNKEILYLGRLDPIQKRVDHLIRIFATVHEDFPDWKLKIVGNGPDKMNLISLAKKMGIENVVEFHDYSDSPEQHLVTASILCLTSRYEGYGLVLAEAMIFGCIPMSYDCGNGVRDILANGRGIIVEKDSITDYVQKLKELLSSPQLCNEIRQKHIEYLNMIDNTSIINQWERLLQPKNES